MPWGDWQFWVVSLFALVAAWVVLRMLVPPGALPGFLSRRKGTSTKTRLTVGGKPVEKSAGGDRNA